MHTVPRYFLMPQIDVRVHTHTHTSAGLHENARAPHLYRF